jgi:hypothetical protein
MVEEGTTKPCVVKAFNLDEKELTEEMIAIFQQGEIILDCLQVALRRE